MPLRSKGFTSDPAVKARLDSCLNLDSMHVLPGSKGDHVSQIQAALFILVPGITLPDNELFDSIAKSGFYGPATAAAVLRYKKNHKPPIVNKAYQDKPDNIVGKMTIQALDDDMFGMDPVEPPKPRTVDRSVRTITLWLNAFIGNDVKNADGSAMSFNLTKGPHVSESAIPGPFNGKVPGFDDCYLTDQRSFQSFNRNASSRIHAEVRIDFTSAVPILTPVGTLGATVDTVRLRVSTGEILNQKRGVARGGFRPHSGFIAGSKQVTVRFKIEGNNPIAKMPRIAVIPVGTLPLPIPVPFPSKTDPPSLVDPDIDMAGAFTIDADARTLSFDGFVNGFPFFEGYFIADNQLSLVTTIFQKAPDPGESPATGLPGPPDRHIDVDLRIP